MTSTVLVRERAASYAATRTTTLPVAELAEWLELTYRRIADYLARGGHRPSGPPFARYHRHGDGRFDVTAGFPVDDRFAGDGDIVVEWIPGGRVAVVQHRGGDEAMVPEYRRLAEWLNSHHAVASSGPYEVYRKGPGDVSDPAAQLTDIVQPFRLDAPPARPKGP